MQKFAGGAAPTGALAAAIVGTITDTLIIMDPMGRILFLSSMTDNVIGLTPAEWIGRSALDFVHPDDASLVAERLHPASNRAAFGRQFVRIRVSPQDDDTWLPVEVHGFNPIDFDGVPAILVSVRDTTGYLTFERARSLAAKSFDVLDRDANEPINNRQMIVEELLPDMLRGPRTSPQLLLIHLAITNSSGHTTAVRQIAEAIEEATRDDDLVALLSNDSLVIACPGISTTRDANTFAKRIHDACVQIDSGNSIPNVRLGFAMTSLGDDLDEVIEFAATASMFLLS